MASIGVNSLTYNSATLYVAELNTTTTYKSIYISCNGSTSPNLAKGSISSTSNGWTVYGLSGDSYYSVSSTITSSGGSVAYPSGGFSTPSAPQPPSGISSVSLTPSSSSAVIYVSWSSASGATGYRAEIYRGSTFIDSIGTSGTSTQFGGLSEYTEYRVKVYAQNANGNGAPNDYNYATTGDFTPPSVSYLGASGLGSLTFSWNASDSGSGLRSSNRYRLYIGSRDGSSATLVASGWTNSSSTSWVTDSGGNGLIANAYYWVGVRAYDNWGNESSLLSYQIQFKITRPNNWTWDFAKNSGGTFTLTASEWNNFTARINQFRLYRGYNTYAFSTVVKGNTAFASQLNEAIIGMRAMSSPPAEVSSGAYANASFINGLSNTLNSIT